jgi:hypothetical protein
MNTSAQRIEIIIEIIIECIVIRTPVGELVYQQTRYIKIYDKIVKNVRHV